MSPPSEDLPAKAEDTVSNPGLIAVRLEHRPR